MYAHAAIQNAASGAGAFHGLEIYEQGTNVGDIIHHNRGGTKFNFAHAKNNKHQTRPTPIGGSSCG